MADRINIESRCVAAFVQVLAALPHETRAIVTATENGTAWAHVEMSPMTDSYRSAFPVDSNGVRGDDRKRSQCGVMVSSLTPAEGIHALTVVVNRARKMA